MSKQKKYKYILDIEIDCNDETVFISTLENIVSSIKKGNVYGLDHNDTERFIYHVNKEESK